MEMHMVHVNSKYLNDDGTVDPVAYQTPDGLAVLGFMFKVKSTEVTIINNMVEIGKWSEFNYHVLLVANSSHYITIIF